MAKKKTPAKAEDKTAAKDAAEVEPVTEAAPAETEARNAKAEAQAARNRLLKYKAGQPLGGAYTVYEGDVDAEPAVFHYEGNASADAHKRAIEHATQLRREGKIACVVMTDSRVVA